MDPAFASVIADLLINLSAGWFGAAVIIPINTRQTGKIRFAYLIANLVLATLSLLTAYTLRKQT